LILVGFPFNVSWRLIAPNNDKNSFGNFDKGKQMK